jgi:hypothetical protein
MVLVPSFLEVDGLVVPLRIEPPFDDVPPRVLVRDHATNPLLKGMMYVVGGLIRRPAQEVLSLIRNRQDLPLRQELESGPVPAEYVDDFKRDARNWASLTGNWPDMSDVYSVGASFLRDNLIIPRQTFLKLMEKLYELNAEVREGKREARIDETMEVPAARPPLPPPPPPWLDEEMKRLEWQAYSLDIDDPLERGEVSVRELEHLAVDRGFLMRMLEMAYKRVRQGEVDIPARFERLGLTTLMEYQRAEPQLEAYLADGERQRIVGEAVAEAKQQAGVTGPATVAELAAAAGYEVTPYTADVSIDLFRLPEAERPPGMSRHEWLARCEAQFVLTRIAGTGEEEITGTGDLFTEVAGHRVRLRCRPELWPSVPVMWRAELCEGGAEVRDG